MRWIIIVVFDKNSEGSLSDSSEEETEDIEEEEEVPVKVSKIAWYKVTPGDNLTEIARKFKTSVGEICRINKISSSKKLYVGLRLRVR